MPDRNPDLDRLRSNLRLLAMLCAPIAAAVVWIFGTPWVVIPIAGLLGVYAGAIYAWSHLSARRRREQRDPLPLGDRLYGLAADFTPAVIWGGLLAGAIGIGNHAALVLA